MTTIPYDTDRSSLVFNFYNKSIESEEVSINMSIIDNNRINGLCLFYQIRQKPITPRLNL